MKNKMTADPPEIRRLDICGQICPSSLLTTLREVNSHKKQLRDGTLQLDILTDNHDSTNRIVEAISNMGYHVSVSDRKKYFQVTICKSP